MSHAHLRDGLPLHSIQAQNFPPATLKMRMMLARAAQHGSGQKKNLFSNLLDLAVVNTYIDLSSCDGKKISQRDFRLTLIREMLARSGHEPRPSMPVGRPASASTNIGRLTRVTISTGQAAIPRNGEVACVWRVA